MKGGIRRCSRCSGTLSFEGRPSRGATCPHCGAYLHSCVNCSFHSPGRHNDCREPQAEHVGDKKSANFCDFFRFRETFDGEGGGQAGPDHGKNSGGNSPPGRSPYGGEGQTARDRFGKLFGK